MSPRLFWSRIKLQHQGVWLSWAAVAALALLCGALGLLQYRWIGEIAEAERARLRDDLKTRLSDLGEALNAQVAADCRALVPSREAIERLGPEPAYAAAWAQWQRAHGAEFARIALAVPQHDALHLILLNTQTGNFAAADWPATWTALRQNLETRLSGPGPGPMPSPQGALFEFPRFAPAAPGEPRRELEWLILELNPAWARNTLLPQMLRAYMGPAAANDYDFEVIDHADPQSPLFTAGNPIGAAQADAAIDLLNLAGPELASRGPGRPQPRGERSRPGPPDFDHSPPHRPPSAAARWQLRARHRAGSLDLLIARNRRRNLAVSGAVLLLILATAAMLVRLSRRAHRLAEREMTFVAGVSHELRTPLTVIRIAAWNLRGDWLTHRPERVGQYGSLIHQESVKLERLVEQVLHFASAKAGHPTQRENVAASDIVNGAVQSARAALEGTGIQLQTQIARHLPALLADRLALTRAIENLLENARKYGTGESRWIGLAADKVVDRQGPALEIRVSDRGPGIPKQEQAHIFDPFVRGKEAVREQIRGTGLGLSLVRSIAEAHGGSVRVRSEPGRGTDFILRIPAAI